MQPYDAKAQREIEEWHDRSPLLPRPELPERVQQAGKDLVARGKDGFDHLPGSDQLREAIDSAMSGVVSTIGTTAAASVNQRAILRRYKRGEHLVDRIDAIGSLDLEVSDRAFPRRKKLAYMLGSAGQGGAAGAAASVSEFGAVFGGVFGAGAGAVPGTLALAGVIVADAAATLGSAARIVAETAAHYGYDPNDPAEELFLTSVLGAAMAGTQGAKIAAHRELNHVAGLLARRAPKAALKKVNLGRVLPKVWPRLIERTTHRQMGKLIPAAGIVAGAGLNASLMKRVSDEAYFAYRERRLFDRYGERDSAISDPPVDGEVVDGTLVLDLLDEDDDDPTQTIESAQ
ncbi:EcsC family protein [Patulibacter americanus]|uniref:EcsC family protein n=1 Tax=Patulibacter americanus TaxID=588672 RepID=UPI0004105CC8|nr:EcsC family protein [Patulibacter americanus]